MSDNPSNDTYAPRTGKMFNSAGGVANVADLLTTIANNGGGGGGGGGVVTIAAGGVVSGAYLDGALVTVGTKADTAVTNPALSGSLIGLTKGILTAVNAGIGGGAVTLASGAVAAGAYSAGAVVSGAFVAGAIADGGIVTFGAIADAAVTGDNSGSGNAHLRGLTKALTGTGTAYDSTNQALKVVIVANTITPATTPLPNQAFDSTLTYGQSVLPAATAALSTHLPAVVALHPSSALPAGTNVIGTVSGTTTAIIPTLAVTASAYAANQCMGGKLTLTNAMRISGGTGTWQSITITDHGNQKPLLDIILFGANPAGTYTDHSAFPTMSVADNALVLGRISIVSTDWVTIGGSAYCTKVVGAIPVKATGSANFYAAMNVTSGTPTPVATTDLNTVFGFLAD